MDYEKAKQLLEELEQTKKEYHEAKHQHFEEIQKVIRKKRKDGSTDVIYENPEEEKRLNDLETEKYHKWCDLGREFLNSIKDFEIKNPENIIAARMTKGYDGKVDVFEVTDLLHLPLSEKKQEGTIYTPYKFDLNGVATRTIETISYKIKRIDNKVYLLSKVEDFIDLWS